MAAIPTTWLFAVAFLLAGCLGPPGPADPPLDGTTPTNPPAPTTQPIALAIVLAPMNATAGLDENVTVTWRVNTNQPDRHLIAHTGVHYADRSVADPETPTDYGNTSGAVEPADVPGTFETTISSSLETTLYVRAHALTIDDNGSHHYWSDEQAITFNASAADPGTVTVEIGTVRMGSNADYDPDPLTIPVGTGVRWHNADTPSHTATSIAGPESFDSGNIAADGTSDTTLFNAPGTYKYGCQYHPSMGATIVVT